VARFEQKLSPFPVPEWLSIESFYSSGRVLLTPLKTLLQEDVTIPGDVPE